MSREDVEATIIILSILFLVLLVALFATIWHFSEANRIVDCAIKTELGADLCRAIVTGVYPSGR